MELAERRLPVYKLLYHKTVLKQTRSFSDNIVKCNFTFKVGWRGKTYVETHDVCEYTPELRGIDLLDVHYLKLTDKAVLTEEQYNDYCIIAGVN